MTFKKEKKFDSLLEYELYNSLKRYLNEDFFIDIQCESVTNYGTYYIDIVCEINSKRIGIECDGKEYHLDYNKDIWRDTLILSKGIVNSIFRIQAKYIRDDILPLCLYMMNIIEPSLLSLRSRENLLILSRSIFSNDFYDVPYEGYVNENEPDDENYDYVLNGESRIELNREIGSQFISYLGVYRDLSIGYHSLNKKNVCYKINEFIKNNPGLSLVELKRKYYSSDDN